MKERTGMDSKTLIVINTEALNPIVYSAKIDSRFSISDAAHEFFKENEIKFGEWEVENIESELSHGDCYWKDELYCFCIVPNN